MIPHNHASQKLPFRKKPVVFCVLLLGGLLLAVPWFQGSPDSPIRGLQQSTLPISLESYQVTALRGKGETWFLTVKPNEIMEKKTVLIVAIDPQWTLEEAEKNFRRAHTQAGEIVRTFLKHNSDEELETKLKHLTGKKDLSLADFSRHVDIRHLANGASKVVYLVTFQQKTKSASLVRFIMKISKSSKNSFQQWLPYQKRAVENSNGLVPKLGDIYKTKAGLAYFEEEIPGPVVHVFSKKGVLPLIIRRKIIRTIVQLYQTTGAIPRDINTNNLILQNPGKESERAVMIDFSIPLMEKPEQILEALLYYYGSEPRLRSHRYPHWKMGARLAGLWLPTKKKSTSFMKDKLIIDTILEILGEAKGVAFLKEGLHNLQQEDRTQFHRLVQEPLYAHKWRRRNRVSGIQWFIAQLSWNLYFMEFTQNLEHYLSSIQASPEAAGIFPTS